MTPQNLWLLVILPKMIPQSLFSSRKKAPQKMAHPVPTYMVVTPPGEYLLLNWMKSWSSINHQLNHHPAKKQQLDSIRNKTELRFILLLRKYSSTAFSDHWYKFFCLIATYHQLPWKRIRGLHKQNARVLLVLPLIVFQGCWVLAPFLHLLKSRWWLPKYLLSTKSYEWILLHIKWGIWLFQKKGFYTKDCCSQAAEKGNVW